MKPPTAREPVKRSKRELKAEKHKLRDLKTAKYTSVTHNPGEKKKRKETTNY
jgi:hypothetical protein